MNCVSVFKLILAPVTLHSSFITYFIHQHYLTLTQVLIKLALVHCLRAYYGKYAVSGWARIRILFGMSSLLIDMVGDWFNGSLRVMLNGMSSPLLCFVTMKLNLSLSKNHQHKLFDSVQSFKIGHLSRTMQAWWQMTFVLIAWHHVTTSSELGMDWFTNPLSSTQLPWGLSFILAMVIRCWPS